MRAVYCSIVVTILCNGLSFGVSSSDESNPAMIWWPEKPLIFSENKTSESIKDLKGILPEIWKSVVEHYQSSLSRHDLDRLIDGETLEKPSPLSKKEFSEIVAGKGALMPVKLRRGKDSCLGMHFVKLIDSPGVAVLMKKTLTGTDLLNAILLAWPILIFVILSASLSGFVIWFLVSP